MRCLSPPVRRSSHLFGDSRGGGFSGTALGRRPQNRAKKTKCKVIFPACLARSGRSPAGGCRCLLAWCSCPSVLRVLVVFLSLAFPPFFGRRPKERSLSACGRKGTDPSTGLFRYPFTCDRPGVPLRSTLRALLYFTCGPSLRVAAGGSDGLRPLGQTFFSWRACPQG